MRRFAAALAVVVLAAAPTRGEETCPTLFADGRTPALVNPKLAQQTIPLCYDAFAVLHSGVTRTPLYAAEHLTRQSVADARGVARDDAFHEETRLPPDGRAALEDYVRSGFDRGHLAPAGDMPTEPAQAQSFSLANIVPQDRALNRGLWADIEESTRRLATRRGSLFVVTGTIFSGDAVQAIRGGVLVPTQLFKALFDPVTGEAGAYLAQNADGKAWKAISIQDLQTVAGIDAFPGLPPAARAAAMDLPEPHAFIRDGTGRDGTEAHPRREPRERASRDQTWQDWLGRAFTRAVRRAFRDLLRAIF